MMNILIENYIKKLTFDDFKYYLNKYEINIDYNNQKYFFNLLKNNIKDILLRPNYYLNIIKNKIDSNNYSKIHNLYSIYSKKLYH